MTSESHESQSSTSPHFQLEDLPRRGPFRVQPDFVSKSWLYGSLWFLFFGSLFVLLSWSASTRVLTLLETSKIWKQGIEAHDLGHLKQKRISYRTGALFHHFTVLYRTQDGKSYTTHVDFFRFPTDFTKQPPYRIRYLPQNPQKMTISWAYDAIPHGWLLVAVLLVGILLLGFEIYSLCFQRIRDAYLVQSMAEHGSLVSAAVDHVELSASSNTSNQKYVYQFTFQGDKSYQGTYKFSDQEDQPIILGTPDNMNVVVLVGTTGGKYRVLRHDGYPLILS